MVNCTTRLDTGLTFYHTIYQWSHQISYDTSNLDSSYIIKYFMKFLLLLALARTTVVKGHTSKGLEGILANSGGDRRIRYLRRMRKEEDNGLVSIHGEIVNENVSPTFNLSGKEPQKWNHGSYAVASKRSGTIKIHVPQDTQVGDTLFLFLR